MTGLEGGMWAEVSGGPGVARSNDGERGTDGLIGEPKETGLWEGFGREDMVGGPEVSGCEDGPRKSSTRELTGTVFCPEFKEEGLEVKDANGNWDSKKCTSR